MGSTLKYSPSSQISPSVVSALFSQQTHSYSKSSFTLSKLRFFGLRAPKTNSCYTTSKVGTCLTNVLDKSYFCFTVKNITFVRVNKYISDMKVKIVNKSAFDTPFYATEKSAGMDIKANIEEPIVLRPLQRAMVPTGLYIALPEGTEAQIRPRSGLAAKHGITVLNTPGTIDADYRGEIKVILVNLSNDDFTINPGERIAQMVVARYEKVEWDSVEVLDETERGTGGFGSTGR